MLTKEDLTTVTRNWNQRPESIDRPPMPRSSTAKTKRAAQLRLRELQDELRIEKESAL